jgi:hypothetical protein
MDIPRSSQTDMARSRKRRNKGHHNRRQKKNTAKARAGKAAKAKKRTRTRPHNTSANSIQILENYLKEANAETEKWKKKYTNERQRTRRLQKANEQLRAKHTVAKVDAFQARIIIERLANDIEELKKQDSITIAYLQDQIRALDGKRKDLAHDRTVLQKRLRRMKALKQSLSRSQDAKRTTLGVVKIRERGVYNKRIRQLARYMASTGMAEAKVGEALKEVGKVFGITVKECMSKRTVQRCILEAGVAADIQLAYEIGKASSMSLSLYAQLAADRSLELTYSSDSTSHRHIEYESRFIALQVFDYDDPDAQPEWKLRSLGVDTSVNHTSETQLAGLRRRLEDLAKLFNQSPIAIREKLYFDVEDFICKLIGTSGDHAADQKKGHRLLKEWRIRIVLKRLGEEAVKKWDPGQVVGMLLGLKLQQIQNIGQARWDSMTEDEKAETDATVLREIGRQVFENLPETDKAKLTRFFRTGCCMHKDLNCFRSGDKSMQAMWAEIGKPPPILLANKDNAAVLKDYSSGEAPNESQQRALDVSKRGGSKAVELGGMICRNKDSKKGQHDSYKFWMVEHAGRDVPFPDVSNTRYGSHGEAAAVILIHRDHFISFSNKLFYMKSGHSNIEKNFAASLEDIPTLTELAALALYHICVSRPFMRHVRQHPNLLDLEPFFKKKEGFLVSVASNPHLWTCATENLDKVLLDPDEPEDFTIEALDAVHLLAPGLPDLDHAVVAFLKGAHTAWTERFSEEFRDPEGLGTLTEEERADLFFSSTNDANEGALGSWRLAQRRRVTETLHKFNSSFKVKLNNTEAFINHKLTEDEDQIFLQKQARQRDEAHLQAEIKRAQVQADKEKAAENIAKEAAKLNRQKVREEAIRSTANKLVLDDAEIEKLKKPELKAQTDWHRKTEEDLGLTVKVPMKSHLNNNEKLIIALKSAVQRYKERLRLASLESNLGTVEEGAGTIPTSPQEFDDNYEYDFNDDHT